MQCTDRSELGEDRWETFGMLWTYISVCLDGWKRWKFLFSSPVLMSQWGKYSDTSFTSYRGKQSCVQYSLLIIRSGTTKCSISALGIILSPFSMLLSVDQKLWLFLDFGVSSQHPTDRGLSIPNERHILYVENMQTRCCHHIPNSLTTWHLGCVDVMRNHAVTKVGRKTQGERCDICPRNLHLFRVWSPETLVSWSLCLVDTEAQAAAFCFHKHVWLGQVQTSTENVH